MRELDNGVLRNPSRLLVYDRKGQPMSPYTESKSYMTHTIDLDLR